MSNDNNVFETLRDDEDRSVEESEMGSSTADFLEEDRESNSGQAPGPRPDDLSDVDTKVGQSVSIFNTSGLVPGVEEKENGDFAIRRNPRDGRVPTGPLLAAVWPEGMSDPRGIKMGDLASYQGTTVSGLTHPGQGPRGGDLTRVEGLPDGPHARSGQVTQAMFRNPARLPPFRGSEQDGKASGQKPSTEAKILPQQSERPRGKGGVKMEWESSDEEEARDDLLSLKDQWLAEGERLDEAAEEGEKTLMRVMNHVRAVALDRDAHFEAGDEGGIAFTRAKLSREFAEEGDLMGLLLLEAEDQGALKLRPSDLVHGLMEDWNANWELFLASKKTEFSKEDVMEVLGQATGLIEDWRDELGAACGPDAVIQLMERHRALTEALAGKKGVSPLAARLFPREVAGEIMEWYARLLAGLMEVQRLREVTRKAVGCLGGFLQNYPGPKLVVRSESHFVGRSSVGALSKRFDAAGITGKGRGAAEEPGGGSVRGGGSMKGVSEPEGRSPAEYGYDFRPGSQPVQAFGGGAPVRLLGPEFLSRRVSATPKAVSTHSDQGGGGGSGLRSLMAGGADDLSEAGDSLSGFTGMDRTMIEEEVTAYVTERLAEQGNETPLTVGTLVDNIPRLGMFTRKGHEASVTGNFTKAVRELKPYSDGVFVSVPQWWKRINEIGDDNGWSLPMRVRFLARTGGLALKVHDSHRQRVIDFMRDYRDWMPQYEPQRPEGDNRYWLYLWIEVGLKFVQEFHTIQHPEVIEEGLNVLFKDPKYAFKSKTDPLNEDFYRVVLLYQDLNVWLVERSSDLVNSPFYVYRLLKKWLTRECGVAGEIAGGLIDKALAKLSTEPESVLPRHHGLSARELVDIKQRGQGNAKTETYRLILERLKKRAMQKDLEYNATSLAQVSDLYGKGASKSDPDWEKNKGDRKRDRKANSVVVSTDYSSLTLNTTTSAGGGATARPPACPHCGMFHGELKKTCPFWDPTTKTFKVKNFLGFRSVRKIEADGTSTVNDFWLKKLKNFGFRAMDITKEEDRQKIIKDLRAAAAAWPEASVEERRRYASENKRFMNLAKIEEGGRPELSVNMAKSSSSSSRKPKSGKKKSQKKRSSSQDSGTSSSSGSDRSSDSDDDSDGSGQHM